MSQLSYLEALKGVISDDDIEGMIGLVDAHKNWGAFPVKHVQSGLIVALVDEVKRLRETVGGYKSVPKGADPLDVVRE